jgi:hypothetical protein
MTSTPEQRVQAAMRAKRLNTFIQGNAPSLAPYEDHRGFAQHDKLRYDISAALAPLEAENARLREAIAWKNAALTMIERDTFSDWTIPRNIARAALQDKPS